jgi:hypothetical protein
VGDRESEGRLLLRSLFVVTSPARRWRCAGDPAPRPVAVALINTIGALDFLRPRCGLFVIVQACLHPLNNPQRNKHPPLKLAVSTLWRCQILYKPKPCCDLRVNEWRNEGAPIMYIGPDGKRREVLSRAPCGHSGALSLHTCASARAREMIELFRLQATTSWPINCCDDLGLPSSAGSF